MTDPAGVSTYLVVDGENIDATLGISVLGRRPQPRGAAALGAGPRVRRGGSGASRSRACSSSTPRTGSLPHALRPGAARDGLPADPAEPAASGEKVVDIGIQRTLAALEDRPGDVLLASHDGDFLPEIERLLGADRRVGLIGFREFVNVGFDELAEQGLAFYDLEDDVRCFNAILPRIRIIPLDEFDPVAFL